MSKLLKEFAEIPMANNYVRAKIVIDSHGKPIAIQDENCELIRLYTRDELKKGKIGKDK